MKISIVTATFNSAPFIASCIDSVHEQTEIDLEHIIIDGASKDNTIEIIKSRPNRVKTIISEPDKGIYDAMNKGIKLANGDIIGILNSDDFYASDNILAKIAQTFTTTNCDALYGNLNFVAPTDTNKVIRHWKSSPFISGSFTKGWHPPHPTFFVKKEVYEKYGLFDTNLDVSADFELMLRFIEKNCIKVSFLDETIVKMRYGGESTGSLKKIIEGNRNILRAFKKNGIKVSPFYPVLRLIPKLKQFISK
ncbi:glycosyltransferase family 2 protein [uncultured Sunxiuqinia sp.]|uniref:glycosyltransferase family 2 protein n=1 Tax=uncultured Sunxiuqinia sp. TaxID=1573825 RepID=UPI00262508E8|nr:glycosyltransferase family 2 protein [uncultured Sunxiuqinia sp.]